MTAGTLFLNARSGSRDSRIADALAARARERGLDVVLIGRDAPMAALLRERVERGTPLIVAAGGDGTVNAALQILVGTDVPLGIVPLGTVNHFAKELELPRTWEAAFDVAVSGERRAVDVGVINDRYFLNSVYAGFYPEVFRAREKLRHYGKWRAFAKAIRLGFHHFPQVALVIESDHHMTTARTPFFAVSVNAYDLAQPQLVATKTALDEGRLTVYWLSRRRRSDFVQTIWRYLRGDAGSVDGLRRFHTKDLRLQASKPLRVAIDGEIAHLESPIRIRVVPQGLIVKAPRT